MYTPVRDLWVGRLGLPSVETSIGEMLGSEITTTGDSTAVGARKAKGFTLTFPIHGGTGDPNPYLIGNRMRRQIRSIMQNADYRLAALYIRFLFDAERNGWMVIGTATLNDATGGPTMADYTLTLDNAFRVAAINTQRDGYRIDIADMRLNTAPLDYFGQVINTGMIFASIPALSIPALPVGATDPGVLEAPVTVATGRVGSDGIVPIAVSKAGAFYGLAASGLRNGDIVSWERPETSFNLGDVIAYDRRGFLGPFGVGGAYDVAPFPATTGVADVQAAYGWEEVYGPDYPYNWLTTGQAKDAPVLCNGLTRVRYEPSGGPSVLVDAWNPATSAFVEQGNIAWGNAANGSPDVTWLSAAMLEYTPERAVMEIVTLSAGGYRQRAVFTLQRGWLGPRVEVYTAGFPIVFYSTPTTDTNVSVMKLDSPALSTVTGGVYQSNAVGSGTSPWTTGTVLGAATFTGENEVALIRQGQSHQANFAVLQVCQVYLENVTVYASASESLVFSSASTETGYAANWIGVHIAYTPLVSGQVEEAETIRNASGTTAQISDATASNGFAVTDTQTGSTAATLALTAATVLSGATYRMFARVKVSTGTGSIAWRFGSTATLVYATTTSTSYVWLDLGEASVAVVNSGLQVWAHTSGSGTVTIDRVEMPLISERASAYSGARDLGQQVLYDQRVQTRKVTR